MDIFSVDLTPNEITFIRQALDVVSISGRDAKFLANLQVKMEGEIAEIQRQLNEIPPPPGETGMKSPVKK